MESTHNQKESVNSYPLSSWSRVFLRTIFLGRLTLPLDFPGPDVLPNRPR